MLAMTPAAGTVGSVCGQTEAALVWQAPGGHGARWDPTVTRKSVGLVVHGMGEQPSGSALRHVANEFLPLIRARIDPRAGIAVSPLDGPGPAEVRIWFDAPANADGGDGPGKPSERWEIRFIEVWWARSFGPATLGDMLGGTGRFVQTVAAGLISAWLANGRERRLSRLLAKRAAGRVGEQDFARQAAGLEQKLAAPRIGLRRLVYPSGGFWGPALAQRVIVDVMLLAGAAALLPLLLALSALRPVRTPRLLPPPAARAYDAVAGALTRHLGDLWVYLQQPWEASQIRGRFEERMHALLDGVEACPVDSVFVIAHSLGAAIAFEALTGRRMTRRLQRVFGRRPAPQVHFISVGSALNSVWDIAPAAERFRFYRTLPPFVRWLDLWATTDPVSRGPLRPPVSLRALRFDSRPVVNQMDAFSDHSAYWKNAEEVVAPILDRITCGTVHSLLQMDVAARRRRVEVLALAKALAWLVLPGVFVALVIGGGDGWVRPPAPNLVLGKAWQRLLAAPTVWALAAAAVAVLLYSTVVAWAWNQWDRRARYRRPRATQGGDTNLWGDQPGDSRAGAASGDTLRKLGRHKGG